MELTWQITHLKDRIPLIAVAPRCFVSEDLCGDVVHLVSRDVVPWLDPIGRFRCSSTIECLTPSPNADGVDHAFQSDTYDKKLRFKLQVFKEKGR